MGRRVSEDTSCSCLSTCAAEHLWCPGSDWLDVKLLVSGSRDFKDYALVERWLRALLQPGDILVHGAARGADTLADDIAKRMGIERRFYPADWAQHGRAAGPIRNRHMLVKERPDVVLAFPLPEGKGTQDMIRISVHAKVPTIVGNDPVWIARLDDGSFKSFLVGNGAN